MIDNAKLDRLAEAVLDAEAQRVRADELAKAARTVHARAWSELKSYAAATVPLGRKPAGVIDDALNRVRAKLDAIADDCAKGRAEDSDYRSQPTEADHE
jgi:hypothetical protein